MIGELQAENIRLAQELKELKNSQELVTIQLQARQRAEEEALDLKNNNIRLQQQAEDGATFASYCSPRLNTISQIVEELRKRMPPVAPLGNLCLTSPFD